MLKIRIIAIVIALVLTLLTIQLIPIVTHHYMSFVDGLNKEQRAWLAWAQSGLGFAVAAVAFWLWRRKAKSEK